MLGLQMRMPLPDVCLIGVGTSIRTPIGHHVPEDSTHLRAPRIQNQLGGSAKFAIRDTLRLPA